DRPRSECPVEDDIPAGATSCIEIDCLLNDLAGMQKYTRLQSAAGKRRILRGGKDVRRPDCVRRSRLQARAQAAGVVQIVVSTRKDALLRMNRHEPTVRVQ